MACKTCGSRIPQSSLLKITSDTDVVMIANSKFSVQRFTNKLTGNVYLVGYKTGEFVVRAEDVSYMLSLRNRAGRLFKIVKTAELVPQSIEEEPVLLNDETIEVEFTQEKKSRRKTVKEA